MAYTIRGWELYYYPTLANDSKPMSEHLKTSGCPLTQLVDQVIQARLISFSPVRGINGHCAGRRRCR